MFYSIRRGWVSLISALVFLISNGAMAQILWDSESQAEDSLSRYRYFDRNNISLQAFNLAPAYPYFEQHGRLIDTAPTNTPHVSARLTFHPNTNYTATVYLFPSIYSYANKGLLDKPLIVSDAFDPRSERGPYQLMSSTRYKALLNSDPSFQSPRTGNYARDIVFVDFSQGGGDIFINAQLLLRVMDWVQSQAREDSLVGGISMGGVVARVALLYALPENNVQNTDFSRRIKGFISIDAPHDGASLAPRLQKVTCALSEHENLPDSESSNSAVGSWKQLRVPAAHQMLYAHYYRGDGSTRCGAGYFSSAAHDRFYARIGELGARFEGRFRGFRPDIPSTAVAYSNFHKPHGAINVEQQINIGEVDAPVADSRTIYAGGVDAHKYDLYPGSTGFWYWKTFSRESVQYISLKSPNGELFKGTFIPIHSALGLSNGFNSLAPVTQNPKLLARFSVFDSVHFQSEPYNNYQRDFHQKPNYVPNINDKRFEHMVFDRPLMANIQKALADVSYAARVLSYDERYLVLKHYRECFGRDPENSEAFDSWLSVGRSRGIHRMIKDICQQPEAQNPSVVRRAIVTGYQDCYARAPEEGAVDAWMSYWGNAYGVEGLRREMCDQPEARELWKLQEVARNSYARCLKRLPEAGAAEAWAKIGLGIGMLAMVDSICGSAEGVAQLAKYENPLNERYLVYKRYRECLGRNPESREAVDSWVAYSQIKGHGRAAVEICASEEAQMEGAQRNAIILGYRDCYAREPEAGGVEAWLNGYVRPLGMQNLRREMCRQPESTNLGTIERVVVASFQRCLYRQPDSAAINEWAVYGVRKGMLAMVDGICGSPEGVTHL